MMNNLLAIFFFFFLFHSFLFCLAFRWFFWWIQCGPCQYNSIFQSNFEIIDNKKTANCWIIFLQVSIEFHFLFGEHKKKHFLMSYLHAEIRFFLFIFSWIISTLLVTQQSDTDTTISISLYLLDEKQIKFQNNFKQISRFCSKSRVFFSLKLIY